MSVGDHKVPTWPGRKSLEQLWAMLPSHPQWRTRVGTALTRACQQLATGCIKRADDQAAAAVLPTRHIKWPVQDLPQQGGGGSACPSKCTVDALGRHVAHLHVVERCSMHASCVAAVPRALPL